MITMVISGGILTYSQVQNDKNSHLLSQRSTEITDDLHQSAIDTLRFLVDPSYEYCEYECEKDENSTCDRLSKTVVSVSQKGLANERFGRSEVARLPANSSINLMFETYSVSRRSDSCSTNYYVTVESFDTYLESVQKEIDADISTFNPMSRKEFFESLQSQKSLDLLRKFCTDQRPY